MTSWASDDQSELSFARLAPGPRFIAVMNRNRDGYEVPLALEQAGLLECLVTDFYAPDRASTWLPGFLRRRYRSGLPAARCRSSWTSFILQYAAEALRLPMHRVFPVTDRLLARSASRRARRSGACLYAYSSYVDPEAALPPATRVIDFEYHPHPDLGFALLKSDFETYPEVAWSFAQEEAAQSNEQISNAWRRSDAVVCASDMTRKSLEHAGCDPARITVIPYGLSDEVKPIQDRDAGPCRFLFVGQGVQRKGLHHLAHAWRRAAPDNAVLTIVSYRLDPGIAALLDLPGITVLRHQTHDELEALYRQSDVFIMPSLIEGFGLVYLEALSHGCHVVATENTGVFDLRLSVEAATIVSVGDVAELSKTITSIAARKAAGTLDPLAIRNEALGWRWKDFRRAIGEHAFAFLSGKIRGPHLLATSS